MDEIGWYGWLIDYWMEGVSSSIMQLSFISSTSFFWCSHEQILIVSRPTWLVLLSSIYKSKINQSILRDYFDHKITTPEHWALLRAPELWTYGELQWDVNNCPESDGPIEISYDEVCDPSVTADCKAKIVISAERFMANETGKIWECKARPFTKRDCRRLWLSREWNCMGLHLWDNLIENNPVVNHQAKLTDTLIIGIEMTSKLVCIVYLQDTLPGWPCSLLV